MMCDQKTSADNAKWCVDVENAGWKVNLRRMTETILACPLFGRRIELDRLTRLRFGEPQKARVVLVLAAPKYTFAGTRIARQIYGPADSM